MHVSGDRFDPSIEILVHLTSEASLILQYFNIIKPCWSAGNMGRLFDSENVPQHMKSG